MTDYERYQLLQREMKRLGLKHGAVALDQPEYQAAWRASEIVKNRNGGMPPMAENLSQKTAVGAMLAALTLALLFNGSTFNVQGSTLPNSFLHAIHRVETSGRTGAILGDGGRAIGPYQIHRAYWEDSRVPGSYGMVTNEAYARRVVTAYLTRYARAAIARGDFETLARIHNGGPQGAKKSATLPYWHRVRLNIRPFPL